jgi:7-keto-8-aminopelargonate synthetase-like enzyme
LCCGFLLYCIVSYRIILICIVFFSRQIFRKLPHYEAPAAATRARSILLRDSLRDLGLCVKGGDHPIVSIAVGKAKTAREFAKMLKGKA